MSDLGPLSYFLGIEVTSTLDGYYPPKESTSMIFLIVRVSLITALWTLLWSFTLVFMSQTVFLLSLEDPTRYRHLIGSLAYLGITHPNISCRSHPESVHVHPHQRPLQSSLSRPSIHSWYYRLVFVLL
jgi:hypothetical protein